MKKIYTLLAACVLGATAYAAAPVQQPLHIVGMADNAMAAQKLDLRKYELKNNGVDRAMKIKDAQGNEWSSLLGIQGPWVELYTLTDNAGNQVTLDDFPYYELLVALQEPKEGGDFVQLAVSWPGYGVLDDDCIVDGAFSADAARAKYGDKALTPMSYDDFKAAWGDQPLWTVPGMYQFPCIWGDEAMSGVQFYNSNTINGSPAYPVSAQYVEGSGWNYTNATTFDWTSFDEATGDVAYDLSYKYSNTQGGAYSGAKGFQMSGSAVVLGFSDIVFDTIGQVHIFNAGRQQDGDEYTWAYELSMESPLNYYYLAMCDDTMAYRAFDQDGKEVTNYTDTDLPVGIGNYYGAPSYNVAEGGDYHLTFFAGALWAKENSENPYGFWTMAQPTINAAGNAYEARPVANNLVFHWNQAEWGSRDGFYCMYEGYRQPAMPGLTVLGIGDEKYGLNFKVATALTYGHYYIASYTGNIMYHGTPGKWMEFTELPAAVKGGDYNAIGSNPNSVNGVESDAPVVSATYYNFQGQRLSSEPESGLYIIRAVKADGTVKATKVAK